MPRSWLDTVSAVYTASFVGLTAFSLGVFVASYFPREFYKSDSMLYPELVLAHAETLAVLSMFGAACAGIALCLGCFWLNREPSDRLANSTLAAIVLTVLLFLLLPAIQT